MAGREPSQMRRRAVGLCVLVLVLATPGQAFAHTFQLASRQVPNCHMLGLLNVPGFRPEVVLHVWMRVAAMADGCDTQPGSGESQPACGQKRHVRGYAFLQEFNFTSLSIQMQQAMMIHSTAFPTLAMSLKSSVTQRVYPLKLDSPVELGRDNDPEKAIVVMFDISGKLDLDPEDAQSVDFELHVDGFEFTCAVVAWPPPVSRLPEPTTGRHRPAPGQVISTEPEGCGGWHCRPPRTPAWASEASLTEDTQVVVVLSNFFGLPIDQYVTILWAHVVWHHRMGVTKYIQYVTERMTELVHHPGIQALVEQGILELVLWDDMPLHKTEQERGPLDVYQHQHMQYNHAVLRFWGTDTLLLNVDLDEYVMIPEPMHLVEVFKACGSDTTVRALVAERYHAACRVDAPTSECDPEGSLIANWMRLDVADLAARKVPHPVLLLDLSTKPSPNGKVFLDPNWACNVNTHGTWTYWPGQQIRTDSCFSLLHANTLFRWRGAYIRNATEPADYKWTWPGTVGDDDVLKRASHEMRSQRRNKARRTHGAGKRDHL